MWLFALLVLAQSQPAQSVTKDVVTGAAEDEFILSAPRTGVTLKLKGDSLTSATITVTKYPGNVIRGSYRNQTMEIRWTDDRVTGQFGPNGPLAMKPLNLKVRKTEEGIKVDGMFRGVTSHFRIGYGILDGRIGNCRYDLVAMTDVYEGKRTCDGGVPEPASVKIPKKLAQRPPSEVIAFLTVVFLGQRD